MKLDRRDWLTAIGLAAVAFTLNVMGLSSLEYFRHTEADRTLIAWKMYESGEYLVPQLVHSVILTKPPLYYWVVAASMHLFGGVSEWIARFPSVFFSALFVMLQYGVMRKAGGPRESAILSAVILFSSATFFQQASVAEIDLVYGFLSAIAFSIAYFAVLRNSLGLLLAAYAATAIAFLAKGPPVILFFLAGHGIFTALNVTRASLVPAVVRNVLGLLVFSAIVGVWLVALSRYVGWDDILAQFRVEVFDRVVAAKRNYRGPFYYFQAFTAGLAPWSIFFYAALYFFFRGPKTKFAQFNACYFFPAILMLTIAEGKSIRYLFPVYFCAAHLSALFLPAVLSSALMPWIYRAAAVLGGVVSLGTLFAMFLIKIPTVDAETLLSAAMFLAFAAGFLAFATIRRNGRESVVAVVVLMFAIRFGTTAVFYPYRNSQRTVMPIVEKIDEALPQGATLYNVELFERWITYYLKQRGRETYRLSPEEAKNPRAVNGRAYMLLHFAEEGWRVEQLGEVDPTVKVVYEVDRPKNHYLLVEADATKLEHLEPRDFFPTKPSRPFYNNPEKAARTPLAPEHD